jgi:hypothetical protein
MFRSIQGRGESKKRILLTNCGPETVSPR